MLELTNHLGRTLRSSLPGSPRGLAASLATLVDAALLVALADGEATRDELGAVGAFVDGFLGGSTDERTLRRLIDASVSALRREGWDARIDAVAGEAREQGAERQVLAVAALLAHADGRLDDSESHIYFDLAAALGLSLADAQGIARDIERQALGW